MEVSKLEVSPALTIGESRFWVLRYIQTHEAQRKRATARALAKAMRLEPDCKWTENSLMAFLSRLITRGLISAKPVDRYRRTYVINYAHPELPPAIREHMEEDPLLWIRPVVETTPPKEEQADEPAEQAETAPAPAPEVVPADANSTSTASVSMENGELKLNITLNINITAANK